MTIMACGSSKLDDGLGRGVGVAEEGKARRAGPPSCVPEEDGAPLEKEGSAIDTLSLRDAVLAGHFRTPPTCLLFHRHTRTLAI